MKVRKILFMIFSLCFKFVSSVYCKFGQDCELSDGKYVSSIECDETVGPAPKFLPHKLIGELYKAKTPSDKYYFVICAPEGVTVNQDKTVGFSYAEKTSNVDTTQISTTRLNLLDYVGNNHGGGDAIEITGVKGQGKYCPFYYKTKYKCYMFNEKTAFDFNSGLKFKKLRSDDKQIIKKKNSHKSGKAEVRNAVNMRDNLRFAL